MKKNQKRNKAVAHLLAAVLLGGAVAMFPSDVYAFEYANVGEHVEEQQQTVEEQQPKSEGIKVENTNYRSLRTTEIPDTEYGVSMYVVGETSVKYTASKEIRVEAMFSRKNPGTNFVIFYYSFNGGESREIGRTFQYLPTMGGFPYVSNMCSLSIGAIGAGTYSVWAVYDPETGTTYRSSPVTITVSKGSLTYMVENQNIALGSSVSQIACPAESQEGVLGKVEWFDSVTGEKLPEDFLFTSTSTKTKELKWIFTPYYGDDINQNYETPTGSTVFTLTEGKFTEGNNVTIIPYQGDYDGKDHKVAEVSVREQNAQVQYSISTDAGVTWTDYTAACPQIRSVGSVKVKVKVTHEDYKEAIFEKTANISKQIVKIQKIQITGISKQIAANKKITLKANVTPSNATNKTVTWKSSNTNVAKVSSSGVVTIKKKTGGKSVTITATAKDGSGKKATYKIKIMKGVVSKIKVSGAKSVKVGKSIKLNAKVTASKGANKKLKWTSTNPKYATVSASGKVTGKKAGKNKTVKIKVQSTDGSNKSKTIKIKIK